MSRYRSTRLAARSGHDAGIAEAVNDFLLYHRRKGHSENYDRELWSYVALKAAKDRGARLGAANPRARNLTPDAIERGSVRGAAATKRKAQEAYAEIVPIVRERRKEGASLAEIADELNEAGFRTQTGKKFGRMQVKRVIDRTQ